MSFISYCATPFSPILSAPSRVAKFAHSTIFGENLSQQPHGSLAGAYRGQRGRAPLVESCHGVFAESRGNSGASVDHEGVGKKSRLLCNEFARTPRAKHGLDLHRVVDVRMHMQSEAGTDGREVEWAGHTACVIYDCTNPETARTKFTVYTHSHAEHHRSLSPLAPFPWS